MSRARHAKPKPQHHVGRALLVVGLGTGAAASSATIASGYTVKPGDTLSELAEAHNTDWHLLAVTNHLSDPDLIVVGQQLDLSGSAPRVSTRKQRKWHAPVPRVSRRSKANKPAVTPRIVRPRTRLLDAAKGVSSLTGAWRKVANCESSLNPGAVNPSGTYRGLFQFDMATWRSVGGTGDPARASAGEQLKRAKALYAQRGAQPWPQCGRYLR